MRDHLVMYEQAEDGGWGAHSPDVEGVFALGVSREEVEERMAEALAAHLELLPERGADVPEPRTEAGRVAAQREDGGVGKRRCPGLDGPSRPRG